MRDIQGHLGRRLVLAREQAHGDPVPSPLLSRRSGRGGGAGYRLLYSTVEKRSSDSGVGC